MLLKDNLLKGVLLAVPTIGRPIPPSMMFSLASMVPPINFHIISSMVYGMEVADARVGIVKAAIEQKKKYIMLVGDDTEPPAHTVKQLIYRMEHHPKAGVIGGVYCSKSHPPAPLVFRGNGDGSFWDWKAGEFFQVTGIGMDCTMIRTEVFQDLSEPWFKTVREDQHLEGIPAAESWTEDLWFCDKLLKETDWEIWCDSMIMAKHWHHHGGFNWEYFTLRQDSKPFLAEPLKKKQKVILDLGCGPLHFDFKGEGQVITCDIREECSPDKRVDLRQLPFPPDFADVVFSSHTLEHFPRAEVKDVLKEWIRVLKPGGELRLILPDLAWAAQRIQEGIVNVDVLNVLYGSQEYEQNFHQVGFTAESLTKMARSLGIRGLDIAHQGYNIVATGKKRKPRKKPNAKRNSERKPAGRSKPDKQH